MKILVRTFDNDGTCTYVWKKMRSNKPFYNGYYYTEDGCSYNLISILRVVHDYRKSDYVQCEVCGDIMKRDKIEKHYEDRERNANCMKCDWMRLTETDNPPVHIMRQDGLVVTKTVGVPYCSKRYYSTGIKLSEIDKAANCKYYACRRGSTRELYSDFLSRNPNPYKELLTEKAVIAKGWKYIGSTIQGRMYSINSKLIARFDKNGILIYFDYLHRNNAYHFVYSDVYDKLISHYGEFTWEGIADSTRDKCMKQIRKLYN